MAGLWSKIGLYSTTVLNSASQDNSIILFKSCRVTLRVDIEVKQSELEVAHNKVITSIVPGVKFCKDYNEHTV